MSETSKLSLSEVADARRPRIEAMHLQEIEGNPLTPEEVAVFEMFEREAWSHERRLKYILDAIRPPASK